MDVRPSRATPVDSRCLSVHSQVLQILSKLDIHYNHGRYYLYGISQLTSLTLEQNSRCNETSFYGNCIVLLLYWLYVYMCLPEHCSWSTFDLLQTRVIDILALCCGLSFLLTLSDFCIWFHIRVSSSYSLSHHLNVNILKLHN